MVISSAIPQNPAYIRPNAASTVREPQNDQSKQPPLNRTIDAEIDSAAEAAELRPVDAAKQSEEVSGHNKRKPSNDNDIRQAQLVEFNQKGFNASQAFLSVQNLDDLGAIIDTYA